MPLCIRMPSRCFQDILLFTGHGNSPPMYGTRDCRDGDKMLCNSLDPGSLVVDVHIDGIIVPNSQIDLGVVVNVMTRENMLKLNLQGTFKRTTTVLQLVDRSRVTLGGIVEGVMVSIHSWEYPTDFLVLQPKTKFNG